MSLLVANGSATAARLVIHVALLALAIVAVRRFGERRWIGWLALAAIPFMYAELRVLIPPAAVMHDVVVQRWESVVFGTSPAASLAGRFPSVLLSELLHSAYLSYYAIIYLPPLVAFARRDDVVFDATVAGMMVVFALCSLAFVLFPVAGPRYTWVEPAAVPGGPVRHLVLLILGAGSSRGSAFPSSHVAVAVAQSAMALAWQPKIGRPVALATVLLALGAVYGGFHYAVDALAGAAVGLAVSAVVVAQASARLGLPIWKPVIQAR